MATIQEKSLIKTIGTIKNLNGTQKNQPITKEANNNQEKKDAPNVQQSLLLPMASAERTSITIPSVISSLGFDPVRDPLIYELKTKIDNYERMAATENETNDGPEEESEDRVEDESRNEPTSKSKDKYENDRFDRATHKEESDKRNHDIGRERTYEKEENDNICPYGKFCIHHPDLTKKEKELIAQIAGCYRKYVSMARYQCRHKHPPHSASVFAIVKHNFCSRNDKCMFRMCRYSRFQYFSTNEMLKLFDLGVLLPTDVRHYLRAHYSL